MMRHGTLIFAICLMLLSASTLAAQVGVKPNGPVNKTPIPNKPPPTLKLPDLIVYWALVDNPDSNNGRVDVRIKNVGSANAGWSYAVLKVSHISSPGAKPTEKSYHVKVPPIAAGQQADVFIQTNLNLSLDSTCVSIDGTKRIKEGDETNNERCGVVKS